MRRSTTVMEAVRESGAEQWIKEKDGKEWIYLGKLHSAEKCAFLLLFFFFFVHLEEL